MVAPLALPRDAGPQPLGLFRTPGQPEDAGLEQLDVDAGRRLELPGRLPVVLPTRDPQLEERVVTYGVDLGSEHPGRCAPRFPGPAAPVDDQDPPLTPGQLPRAGGADGASTYDHNVMDG